MKLMKAVVAGGLALILGIAITKMMTAADPLESAVDTVMTAGPFAAVVILSDPDGTADVWTFGAIDGVELSRDTRFRLASLTKPVVSAAVLQLVDQGQLSLSDSVPGLLPDISFTDPRARLVTVKDLLRHSSGIHEGTDIPPLFVDPDVLQAELGLEAVTQTDCAGIAAAMAARPLGYDPGSEAVYSNTGFCLLSLIIEKQTALPLEAALRSLVPEAAGLTLDPQSLDVRVEVDPGQSAWLVMNPSVAAGAGGLIGSAKDYLAFLARPVEPSVATALPYPVEGESFLGLGWRIWPGEGCPARTHFGSMPGAFSVAVVSDSGHKFVALFAGRPNEDWPSFMAMVNGACSAFGQPR